MKKQFLNLGKALNKAEQKLINGGGPGDAFHQMTLDEWHSALNSPGFVCPVDGICIILDSGGICVNRCLVEPDGRE